MKAALAYLLLIALSCYAVSAFMGDQMNRKPKRRDEIEAAIDRAVSLNTILASAPCAAA